MTILQTFVSEAGTTHGYGMPDGVGVGITGIMAGDGTILGDGTVGAVTVGATATAGAGITGVVIMVIIGVGHIIITITTEIMAIQMVEEVITMRMPITI